MLFVYTLYCITLIFLKVFVISIMNNSKLIILIKDTNLIENDIKDDKVK